MAGFGGPTTSACRVRLAMGQDPVKYALGIGGFGLLTTLACGLYIALINGGSRNLGLALGAVAGSCRSWYCKSRSN